ncbi:MAG: primosomal protein N', partial [Chitinivibrionales bacterium]|nr:primosomal protein N' [Chitinivibrionales bacterium]
MNSTDAKVVSVGFPIAIPGVFDYALPEHFRGSLVRGTPVLVDIRNTRRWGVALHLKEHSNVDKLKPVLEIKTGSWTDSSTSLIEVYEWMASYYQCELGKVFKPVVRKKLMQTRSRQVKVYRRGDTIPENLTAKQKQALITLLEDPGDEWTGSVLRKQKGISSSVLTALCSKGALVRKNDRQEFRQASELRCAAKPVTVTLTKEQHEICLALNKMLGTGARPCLLHGITGSGKTFIYIELAKTACAQGKGVIILVPEISLTPQTIQRFKDAMGDVIAVMHSRMSEGERRDSLEQVVTGRKRVLIGARSAVLAPMDNVGLIIVDEEHDSSYKQAEMEPRYSARDTAVMRGRFQKALVVLGSATPSLESYYNAQKGKYALFELQKRIGPARLPEVEIIDMNKEHRENNWSFLSRRLHWLIADALARNRQIILLLNRRGYSPSLICKDCGHTYTCKYCSVHLTYHRTDLLLRCHQCGYAVPAPKTCSECNGEHIKYKGTGIQKAEEHIRSLYPSARILRMDQDSTRRKGAHIAILERFANHQADILLGTQMVAKGLDFPGVALVGVLQADVALHIPDFRSSERTFHLLTQVAGRAGRTDDCGQVIIQTYLPSDPAIQLAKGHSYKNFYDLELAGRNALEYPPYGRLARIVVSSTDQDLARKTVFEIAGMIRNYEKKGLGLLGPSPAVISRIKGDYRFSLLCKCTRASVINTALGTVRARTAGYGKKVKIMIDVDP